MSGVGLDRFSIFEGSNRNRWDDRAWRVEKGDAAVEHILDQATDCLIKEAKVAYVDVLAAERIVMQEELRRLAQAPDLA